MRVTIEPGKLVAVAGATETDRRTEELKVKRRIRPKNGGWGW